MSKNKIVAYIGFVVTFTGLIFIAKPEYYFSPGIIFVIGLLIWYKGITDVRKEKLGLPSKLSWWKIAAFAIAAIITLFVLYLLLFLLLLVFKVEF